MIVECWAIILVITAMAGAFLKTGRRTYAVMSLPLLIVPFSYLISGPVSRLWMGIFPTRAAAFPSLCVMTLGLMVACFLCGGLSRNIPSTKARRAYIVCCGIFQIVLTLVLVHSLLPA